MKKAIIGAALLSVSASVGMAQVMFTNELDVATPIGGSVYSATYDPGSDQFLAGSPALDITTYDGTTGAPVGSLDLTGITPGGLGFFALAAGSDGTIYAYENGAGDIWKWDDASDTAPTQAGTGASLYRVGHALGTGVDTLLVFTGTSDNGPAWIWDTADGDSFTIGDTVANASAKSAIAPNADGTVLYTVGDVGGLPINKIVNDGGTWVEDTDPWTAPALGGGPMVYDNENDILFVHPMVGTADTVLALDGTTGETIGQETVTNATGTVTGYCGAFVVPDGAGGTLWMAARGATASDLVMYKWTYAIGATSVGDWDLY